MLLIHISVSVDKLVKHVVQLNGYPMPKHFSNAVSTLICFIIVLTLTDRQCAYSHKLYLKYINHVFLFVNLGSPWASWTNWTTGHQGINNVQSILYLIRQLVSHCWLIKRSNKQEDDGMRHNGVSVFKLDKIQTAGELSIAGA